MGGGVTIRYRGKYEKGLDINRSFLLLSNKNKAWKVQLPGTIK